METEEIVRYIEYSEELKTLFVDIINLKNRGDFSDIMTFAGYTDEMRSKVDSAYPQPYADAIREIYPDFNNGLHCYEYGFNPHGQMVNLKNKVADRILKSF